MIVEGYGRRRYKAEFIRYLIFSQSECDETIVHLEFLVETGSAKEGRIRTLLKDYETLNKLINTRSGLKSILIPTWRMNRSPAILNSMPDVNAEPATRQQEPGNRQQEPGNIFKIKL